MKKAIALAWATMLESGTIGQTRGRNRDKNGMCVTAMLNNVHAVAHPAIAAKQKDPSVYLGSSYGVALEVKKWSGIKSHVGCFGKGPSLMHFGVRHPSLMSANDSGVSFKELAAYISKNYATL